MTRHLVLVKRTAHVGLGYRDYYIKKLAETDVEQDDHHRPRRVLPIFIAIL